MSAIPDNYIIVSNEAFNHWIKATIALHQLYNSFISYKEAASILNIKLPTLMDLIDREILPKYVVAGHAITDRDSVLAYRKQREAFLAARPNVKSANRVDDPDA